jgi:hypothetical protein
LYAGCLARWRSGCCWLLQLLSVVLIPEEHSASITTRWSWQPPSSAWKSAFGARLPAAPAGPQCDEVAPRFVFSVHVVGQQDGVDYRPPFQAPPPWGGWWRGGDFGHGHHLQKPPPCDSSGTNGRPRQAGEHLVARAPFCLLLRSPSTHTPRGCDRERSSSADRRVLEPLIMQISLSLHQFLMLFLAAV